MSILDDIVEVKRQEVSAMDDPVPPEPGKCRGFLFKKISCKPADYHVLYIHLNLVTNY